MMMLRWGWYLQQYSNNYYDYHSFKSSQVKSNQITTLPLFGHHFWHSQVLWFPPIIRKQSIHIPKPFHILSWQFILVIEITAGIYTIVPNELRIWILFMKTFSQSIEEGREKAKEVLRNRGNFDINEISIKVVWIANINQSVSKERIESIDDINDNCYRYYYKPYCGMRCSAKLGPQRSWRRISSVWPSRMIVPKTRTPLRWPASIQLAG